MTKRTLFVFSVLALVAFLACKKGDGSQSMGTASSPEAMAKEFADSMCGKMVECQNKQLEKMPANVRDMAKGQMMNEEKCREMVRKGKSAKAEDDLWKKLTDAEKAQAMRCMKAFPKASCEAIMSNNVPDCAEWRKIMESKGG